MKESVTVTLFGQGLKVGTGMGSFLVGKRQAPGALLLGGIGLGKLELVDSK